MPFQLYIPTYMQFQMRWYACENVRNPYLSDEKTRGVKRSLVADGLFLDNYSYCIFLICVRLRHLICEQFTSFVRGCNDEPFDDC